MTTRFLLPFGALCALAACTTDPDLDGLTNAQERDVGSNPEVADTDGDGLLDGAEVDVGSDPLLVDTDEDGYTDRDEVYEGTDPTDAASGIYAGGWPYVYDKSVIEPNASTFREIGERFLRLQLVDQNGEMVDLYDFYNEEGIPIVIDISAEWCPPCRALSSWIEGGDDPNNYGSLWESGPRRVRRGRVHWVTVMSEDVLGNAPDADLAVRWADEYPSPDIPVLADASQYAPDYAALPFWPTVLLLEPDLTLAEVNGEDYGSAVTVLRELDRRF